MSDNYFFTIDVGNTETSIALIKNYNIDLIKKIKTINLKKKKINIFRSFSQIRKILNVKNKMQCFVSSVVPEVNVLIKKRCKSCLNLNPHFISFKKTKLNIKLKLNNKNQVGADRIANTVAIKSLYKTPALVIDFGTATTFDIIDDIGNYVGGIISPGINLSIKSLHANTSKLPLIKFKKNLNFIGKDTKNAMQSGIYWGYIGLVSFLIRKIQSKFKKKLFIVSTGGYSKIISKDINLINKINENLTIYGLIEIYKLNR